MVDSYVKLPVITGLGTVTEVDAGTGLTGGPITTTGSLALGIPVTVAHGGTNSTTALSNNRVVQSSGGKIVEAAAITASRALISDANGIPVAATTTATEIGYVNGVTSAIQTQLGTKAAGAASSTDNAIARFDSTTGKIIQNSVVSIDDAGNMTFGTTTGAFSPSLMTTIQRDAVSSPSNGMLIYNTTTDKFNVYQAGGWVALVTI